jgi:hypothetical protein
MFKSHRGFYQAPADDSRYHRLWYRLLFNDAHGQTYAGRNCLCNLVRLRNRADNVDRLGLPGAEARCCSAHRYCINHARRSDHESPFKVGCALRDI